MFLLPEIEAIFILNILFVIFGTIAFVLSLRIFLFYNRNATSAEQILLEKQSYLAATIIKYIFYIKIPIFIFFIFTLDKLSHFIPGAMCAAGVVNASEYATPLLFLKLLNLYLFAYWLVLDAEDMKHESQPYLKKKFFLFLLFYALFLGEIILESVTFFSLDVQSVVDCCGVLFSRNDATYISLLLNAPRELLLGSFYTLFGLALFAYVRRDKYLFSFASLLFVPVALISLISVFGIYIYELPTHHCPFCLLQIDYDYVGYFLYIALFLGTFHGATLAFIELENSEKYFRVGLLFMSLYTLVVTLYPLLYFYNNGVWL